jgi:hypothetical protein
MFVDSDAELGRNFLTTYYNYRGLGVVRSPELSQRLEAILGHETVLSRIQRGEISADSINRDSRQMIARLIGIVHQVHDPDEAGPVRPASPALAENIGRAGQAAWWYSLRMPPTRGRRRMLSRAIWS